MPHPFAHQPLPQQLGAEIGRGGFGAVFQALNMATGDVVAVKRLDLKDVDTGGWVRPCSLSAPASVHAPTHVAACWWWPTYLHTQGAPFSFHAHTHTNGTPQTADLAGVEQEMELLKRLRHPNIVAYVDAVRSSSSSSSSQDQHLHILLEYMENGACVGLASSVFGVSYPIPSWAGGWVLLLCVCGDPCLRVQVDEGWEGHDSRDQPSHLHCPAGSLAGVCRRFGPLPEPLVAVYIGQALQGLRYLHEQGKLS